MFTYTCPKCRTQLSCEKLQNGAIRECLKCHQKMRVVQDEGSATSGNASAPRRGSGCGMLLVGVCGVAGIFFGGVIVLASYLLEGKLTPNIAAKDALAQKDLQDTPKADAAGRPGIGEKAQAGGKDAADSKPDSDPNTDDIAKKNRELSTEHSVKPDPDPKLEPKTMTGDDLYNEILKSCVWIVATDGRKIWTGSGSLIDRDERLVLTNQHVANRRCKTVWVFFPIYQGGKLVTERALYLVSDFKKAKPKHVIEAEFVYEQVICDLALIRLSRLPAEVKVKALRLNPQNRKVRPGQTLHTVGGNPEGNTAVWIYSPGAVRQISFEKWQYKDGLQRQAEVIASSVAINGGDSGGAVVDSRGYLVGVNAASSEGVLNVRHIHVNEVRRFLQTAYRQQLEKDFVEPAYEGIATVSVKKLDELMRKLEAADADTRRQAAIDLGKIGSDAQKAAIPLLRLVRSPTEFDAVRRVAASALEEIGAPEPEHLNKLLAALKDKDCKPARRYAARALGYFPEDKHKEVLEALKDALQDDDAKVRENAALALKIYGKAGIDEAYTELMECLRDTEYRVRNAAWETLKAGGLPDVVSSSAVRELLQGEKFNKNPTREARYWGVYLLVRKFKEKGLPLIVEALEQEKNFDDLDFMIYVVQQLKEFRLNSLEVGTILSRALDHRHEDVVNAAIDTIFAIKGNKYKDFLTPDENTVEALIKMCVKFPRMRAKLKGLFEKEAEDFPKIVAEICTTFTTSKGRLGFQSSEKLVEILRKGLGESDDLARRVAVNCLERIGKDKEAAKAAPDLKKALLKEKSAEVRIEILAALAVLGKAGREVLGDDKELQEELDKWISDTHDDNSIARVMASLTLISLYPDQKQGSKAYRVLAQALLLKNADLDIDPIQMMRFAGVRVAPGRPVPDKREKELHERAKQALSHGGVMAGEAVCRVLESRLWSIGSDKPDVIHDKIHARIAAFQVLGQIGPDLTTTFRLSMDVRKQITKALNLNKLGKEDTRVADAARQAQREIFTK